MSDIRKTLASLALALPLLLATACGGPDEEGTDPGRSEIHLDYRYGFVSLVDGTMGVVDLESMATVNTVKEGHRASHMLHVIEDTDQREILYGEWDHNDVLLVRFSEDMKEHEVVERIHSPVQMHGFMGVPPDDAQFLVLPRLELQPSVLFSPEEDDKTLAMYDRNTGQWQTLEMHSPSYAAWGPAGRLYVSETHNKAVSVVDTVSWEVVQTVPVGQETWVTTDAYSIGPKTSNFSPNGRWFATADYEGLSVTVFEVTREGLVKRRVIPFEGATKSVAFTRDGKEAWIVTFDLNGLTREEAYEKAGTLESMGDWYYGPDPANEVANSYRKTSVHVLDTTAADPDDWEEIGTFTTPRGLAQPNMSMEDPGVVYLTTSAGSIYKVDRYSFRILAEAIVGRVGVPVVCGNMAL